MEGGKLELKTGQAFTLTDEEMVGTAEKVSITYKELYLDVCPGDSILIDDGLIGMTVQRIDGKEIICQVKNGGFISNRKGVNVPGVELKMPFVSKRIMKIFSLPSNRSSIISRRPSRERRRIFWNCAGSCRATTARGSISSPRSRTCRVWRTARRSCGWQTAS